MGCGGSTDKPGQNPHISNPQYKPQSQAPTKAQYQAQDQPKPKPYSFPTTYGPETSFQLTVKTLRGVPPFTLPAVKPTLTGRELHEIIKNKSKNPEEMLLVLYGRIIKSDEVEIGKKGLAKEATVYCVYKPKNKGGN